MLKFLVAATLVGSISTVVVFPASDTAVAPPRSFEARPLDARAMTGVRNYLSPRLNGNRVAFCRPGGSDCGKAVADLFCRSHGFEEALTFQRDGVQSHSPEPRFRQIKCWRLQAPVDAGQDVIVESAGASVSNTAAKSDRL